MRSARVWCRLRARRVCMQPWAGQTSRLCPSLVVPRPGGGPRGARTTTKLLLTTSARTVVLAVEGLALPAGRILYLVPCDVLLRNIYRRHPAPCVCTANQTASREARLTDVGGVCLAGLLGALMGLAGG